MYRHFFQCWMWPSCPVLPFSPARPSCPHSAQMFQHADFQRQSQRTEKCHFTPCIVIFFSAENINYFSIGFTNIRSLNIWNHMFWLKKLCNNNKQNEIFKETQKNFQRFLSIEIFWKLWWNTSKDALTNESNKQQCKMLVGWSPHKMNEMKMQKTTFIL